MSSSASPTVPDPDLEIRGGEGVAVIQTLRKGWGRYPKFFFGLSGLSLV